MMIRIIFIVILFLSSNVFAATYLLCEGGSLPLQVKLGNEKLYIKYEGDEEFKNYTKYLVSWTDEIIITERKIKQDKTLFNSHCVNKKSRQWELKEQKKRNNPWYNIKPDSLLEKAIIKLCEENYEDIKNNLEIQKITIDRLIGTLDIENPYPYLESTTYNCEVRKKTLF